MTDTSSNVQKLIGEVLARRESVDHLAQKIRTPEILAKFDKRETQDRGVSLLPVTCSYVCACSSSRTLKW